VSNPRLLSVAVTSGDFDDAGQGAPTPQPRYNRTPTVVGASVLGLAAIGILVLSVTFVTRQDSEPQQAPLNFVESTFSATDPESRTATTTQTITSTSPPQTTEIGGPLDPPISPTTSGSATSSAPPTSEEPEASEAEEDEDDEPTERTTRRGPRTNVTRTLDPYR
jgi:cytoskeletal protein RodZ